MLREGKDIDLTFLLFVALERCVMSQEGRNAEECQTTGVHMGVPNLRMSCIKYRMSLVCKTSVPAVWEGQTDQVSMWEERRQALGSDSVGQGWQAIPSNHTAIVHHCPSDPTGVLILRYFSHMKAASSDPGVQDLLHPRVLDFAHTK